MTEAKMSGGSFRDVAVILERIETEVRQVADGHRLLDEKIDRQNTQLRQEIAEGFSLVHQALREHSEMIKQLQQETKQLQQETKQLQQETKQLQQETKELKQSVSRNSEETGGLRGEMRTLTERFEEHLKAHAA